MLLLSGRVTVLATTVVDIAVVTDARLTAAAVVTDDLAALVVRRQAAGVPVAEAAVGAALVAGRRGHTDTGEAATGSTEVHLLQGAAEGELRIDRAAAALGDESALSVAPESLLVLIRAVCILGEEVAARELADALVRADEDVEAVGAALGAVTHSEVGHLVGVAAEALGLQAEAVARAEHRRGLALDEPALVRLDEAGGVGGGGTEVRGAGVRDAVAVSGSTVARHSRGCFRL